MTGRARAFSAVVVMASAALLAWTLRYVGAGAVGAGFERLGAGLLIVLLLGGVRHALRALAWRLCFEDGAPSAATAFGLYVAGDAVGNITPFGLLASEPSKIVLLGRRVNTGRAISALALENLFYGISIVVVLVAGTAALLSSFSVTSSVRAASLAACAAATGSGAAAVYAVAARRRWLSALFAALRRDPSAARAVEDRVFRFAAAHRPRLVPIALLECGYQTAAIAEIWFVLRAIGAPSSVTAAVVLEGLNRTITVAFQFVPMWIGVDEAGTGLMTAALGIGPAAGVTLALVRKARIAGWTAAGLLTAVVMRFSSTSAQLRGRESRAPARQAPPPAATASPAQRPSERPIAG